MFVRRVSVFAFVVGVFLAAGAASFDVYSEGRLASTKPEGWIRDYLDTMRRGLSGHPEALSYPYDTCLWAGEIQRMSDHGKIWWRYEQAAYYTDGILRLGYALGDKDMIAKGEAGVLYTLEHQLPNGLLGVREIHFDDDVATSDGAADLINGELDAYEKDGDVFRLLKAIDVANAATRVQRSDGCIPRIWTPSGKIEGGSAADIGQALQRIAKYQDVAHALRNAESGEGVAQVEAK